MHTVRRLSALLPMLALAFAAGCSEMPTGTEPALDAQSVDVRSFRSGHGQDVTVEALQIVRRQPQAPKFERKTEVIQARAGVASEATLFFQDGTPFATFRLSAESLEGATLNGQPLADGQKVIIRLRAADNDKFVVDMQPSGLVFNSAAPAEVEFYYDYALLGADEPLSVLKQHSASSPWEKATSWDNRKNHRVRGRVDDFTIYALASTY